MDTVTQMMTTVRIAPPKPRAGFDAIVPRGYRAFLKLRALLPRLPPSRNPVFRMQPWRIAQPSPCRRWFVITPLPGVANRMVLRTPCPGNRQPGA